MKMINNELNKKPTMKLVTHILALSIFMVLISGVLQAQKVSQPSPGARGSWKLLGTVSAKHTADHDVIVIAGPYDYFRRLKFKVTDAPINMQRMVVTYDDGGLPEKIDIRYNMPKGGESREIDLRGGKRKLRTVEFWYDTKGFLNGRANVTLFGIK
jgi:hypothetical protein